ncbi:hypothetical protein P3X46_017721 [Hevea brasiliensis]|uniref:Pentatricopeptide repeat-containing protein n=1 Tax=Hevea brasiliensis TaxID=3981 RepID=A0ABQ9LSP3_HEVBR|nr:hypothetical protein P3X46_017721 [Hevea brasiliensis]
MLLSLFDEMLVCDVVVYNLPISGHGKYGIPKQALYLYSEMVSQGIRERSVLSRCSDSGFPGTEFKFTGELLNLGSFSICILAVHLLVFLCVWDLMSLFGKLPRRNLAIRSLVLRRICELGRFGDFLGLYNDMKLDDLKAYGFSMKRQLHCHAIKVGLANSNALVYFYSTCGSLCEEKKSFQAILLEGVISWNSILSVYADDILFFDVLDLFYMVHFWGKNRQYVHLWVSVYESLPKTTMECCNSLMTSLLHCGIVDDIVQMFGLVVDNDEGIGLDEVWSGHVQLSLQVFQQLPSPNIFCFTSISMDLPPMDDWEENVSTLEIFEAMIRKGLKSDKVTFLCVLTGCSHSGVEAQGGRVDTQHFSCKLDLLG